MSKEMGAGGRFDIFLDSARGYSPRRDMLAPLWKVKICFLGYVFAFVLPWEPHFIPLAGRVSPLRKIPGATPAFRMHFFNLRQRAKIYNTCSDWLKRKSWCTPRICARYSKIFLAISYILFSSQRYLLCKWQTSWLWMHQNVNPSWVEIKWRHNSRGRWMPYLGQQLFLNWIWWACAKTCAKKNNKNSAFSRILSLLRESYVHENQSHIQHNSFAISRFNYSLMKASSFKEFKDAVKRWFILLFLLFVYLFI